MSTALAPPKPLVDGARWAQRDIPFERFSELEVRTAADGSREFVGHAAVFDRLSDDLGGFREKIQRGAFRKVLDDDQDVRFLFNHDPNLIMARTSNGTLELREDPKGLRVYAKLAKTQMSADLDELVTRKDITGMSFSFRVYPNGSDVWQEEGDEIIRTIIAFDSMGDVGPVTFPGYPQTDASMRSIVRGTEIVAAGGEVLLEPLRALSWRIHRGEVPASEEERSAVDAAFARTATVSPWMAERALRAASQEPELRAVIPGKRASVLLEDDEPSGERSALAARRRRLRLSGATP